jgi:putative glutamine amidotransferase
MLKPRIGITRKGGAASQAQEIAHQRYRARVQEAGGYAVDLVAGAKVPRGLSHELEIRGLVFTGGGDLNPVLYGEQNRASHHIDEERDRFEIDLLRAALQSDLPVFAICRGFQLLNVACGGKLLQDIVAPPYRRHAATDGASAEHEIGLVKDSRLHVVLREICLNVNSRHHQAVTLERLGCPLVATAMSAGEDIVEAIEKPGQAWVVGVQWHPERLEDNIRDSFQPLFQDFVRVAAERAEPR